MNTVSVLTVVRNREAHLQNLIAGLSRSGRQPDELIVVDMSDRPVALPESTFSIRRIPLETSLLALSAARNLAASKAVGESLVFLDVDCIPSHDLIREVHRILLEADAIVCPEVRYLGPPSPASSVTDEDLRRRSSTHPARMFPVVGTRLEPNYGLLWSLAFGIARKTFEVIGGFDEEFVGYGAEDTDFGFRAKQLGVPLLFTGGPMAFHQYHGVVVPPVQHVADIVRNANLFHRRWGKWPMENWLCSFKELGLVFFEDDRLELRRSATQEELAAATEPSNVHF